MISLNLNASKLLEKITCFSVTTEEMTKMRYKKMRCVKIAKCTMRPVCNEINLKLTTVQCSHM